MHSAYPASHSTERFAAVRKRSGALSISLLSRVRPMALSALMHLLAARFKPLSLRLVFQFVATMCLISFCSRAVHALPGGPSIEPAPMMYFVSPEGSDSNSGDQSGPWATIQHAADMATPGATVQVASGIYVENQLTLNTSGTASARIRFISGQRWGARIRSSTSYTVISLKGSYLDFVGFDIAGDSGSCLGIADWGSNNQILNNHVHQIPAPAAVCKSNGGAGIDSANYKGRNSDLIGNIVHDIGPWPSEDDRVHGIYHSNYGGHIWNNVVYRCAGFGIELSHFPDHSIVANNTVFNNIYGGIYIAEDNGGTGIAVVNNIVVHNKGWGIVEPSGKTPANSGNLYIDNVIYDNLGHGNMSFNPGSTVSGTIIADPQFASYTGGPDGDYTLLPISPARDHGTSSYAPANDINGGIRPVNGLWDIGAYEYGSKSP
jgi:hypothetical protein